MVGHRDGQVRPAQLATGEAQPLEGLRAGHLVQEVAVDVEDARAVRQPFDDVASQILSKRYAACWRACEPRSC